MFSMKKTEDGTAHKWRFSRIGGIDMVRIETAADLLNLEHLDQKYWTALACPAQGLEMDEKTLALVDTDRDGRVRAPEVIAAVKWACGALKDPGMLLEAGDTLPLAALADRELADAMRDILAALGQDGATGVSLDDALTMAERLSKTPFNGDGVVTVDSAGADAEAARLIKDILATQAGVADRGGKSGVDQATLAAFFESLAAFDAWISRAEGNAAVVLPFGEGTAAAWKAFDAVSGKIDDFFGRSRLAEFDARAAGALNRQENEFLALAARNLTITAEEIKDFPLAHISSGTPALPLVEGINPAWSGAMALFRARLVEPLFGPDATVLKEADWDVIKQRMAPYADWIGAKAGASVESLGIERVRALLAGGGRAGIEALIARDKRAAPRFEGVRKVEKILRFNRDLVRLLHNFVTFTDFYNPARKAVFQAGELYIDGRTCKLVTAVADGGKHAALAGLSKMFLVYCKCTRPSSSETREVVAAVTNGAADHLMAGRNGLFYDRKGRDWDAEIVRVVDNPVNLKQAFLAPYKKFVRLLEEQATKRALAAEAASEARMAETAAAAVTSDKTPPPVPQKIDVGTVAALGVAASALVAVLTGIIGGILGLSWWQIPLAIIGVLLVISGPSLIIAGLKLRLRTLGPILDANAWAINGRLKINIPFGRSLTEVAALPRGAERTLKDPFGGGSSRRIVWLGIAIIAALTAWLAIRAHC